MTIYGVRQPKIYEVPDEIKNNEIVKERIGKLKLRDEIREYEFINYHTLNQLDKMTFEPNSEEKAPDSATGGQGEGAKTQVEINEETTTTPQNNENILRKEVICPGASDENLLEPSQDAPSKPEAPLKEKENGANSGQTNAAFVNLICNTEPNLPMDELFQIDEDNLSPEPFQVARKDSTISDSINKKVPQNSLASISEQILFNDLVRNYKINEYGMQNFNYYLQLFIFFYF